MAAEVRCPSKDQFSYSCLKPAGHGGEHKSLRRPRIDFAALTQAAWSVVSARVAQPVAASLSASSDTGEVSGA